MRDCWKRIVEQKDTNQANSIINTKLLIATFSVQENQDNKNNKWYLDSKATQYMTQQKNWFITYSKVLLNERVFLGDDMSHAIKN